MTRVTGHAWRSSRTAGPSITGYRVRERFAGWTLLELDLVTGRTHQIRVHLDAIGHPVAGDPVYGTGTSRARPGWPRAAVPARVAAGAGLAVDRRADPGDASLPPELEQVLAAAPRGATLTMPPDDVPETGPDVADSTLHADGAPGAVLVIISGPSGVGKDTIIEALRAEPRDPDYHYVVTCTTRPRRARSTASTTSS